LDGTCCWDYQARCRAPVPETCAALGCSKGFQPKQPCQCNSKCRHFGNCCSDYKEVCASQPAKKTCAALGCSKGFQPKQPCQCNSKCKHFGNCCSDYKERCLLRAAAVSDPQDGSQERAEGMSGATLATTLLP